MKFGLNDISTFKYGSSSVKELYYGSNLVWPLEPELILSSNFYQTTQGTVLAYLIFGTTPTFDQTRKVYGSHAARFQATSSQYGYVQYPIPALQPPWTIEFWLYVAYEGTYQAFNNVVESGSVQIAIRDEGAGNVYDIWETDDYDYNENGSLTKGVWRHTALVCDGTQSRLYVNGQQSATYSNDTDTLASTIKIGTLNYSSLAVDYFMDQFRLSSVARYSSNFSPNGSSWPDTSSDPNTVLLLHFDGNFEND
jgi:hypothetical protein